MPDTRTVFLPDAWPVSIHLDTWLLVGSGKATSTSGHTGEWAQRATTDPERPPDRYQIDVYRSEDHYVIAGAHTDPQQLVIRNIGRVLDNRAGVVGAIGAVATDLSVDAAVRRVLVQDVLTSLDPEPIT